MFAVFLNCRAFTARPLASHQMKTRSAAAGFTLIELLVVITIIIILAGLAVGVVPQALERANQVQCLSNARQVNLALRLFADDHDGNFPVYAPNGGSDLTPGTATATTSNEVFQTLFPAYTKQEKIFYVGKSGYCNKTPPDERFADTSTCLAAGENDFGYILNLTNTSNPSLPVVMNGLASTTAYTSDKTKPGGVWGGRKAILARVDGSAEIATCDPTKFYPTRKDASGAPVSIFQAGSGTDEWLAANQTVVNPKPPQQ